MQNCFLWYSSLVWNEFRLFFFEASLKENVFSSRWQCTRENLIKFRRRFQVHIKYFSQHRIVLWNNCILHLQEYIRWLIQSFLRMNWKGMIMNAEKSVLLITNLVIPPKAVQTTKKLRLLSIIFLFNYIVFFVLCIF